jgi:hypothetical protein
MRCLLLAALLFACDEVPPPTPGGAPPTAPAASAQLTAAEPAPASAAAEGWIRPLRPERAPEAKGLYRRAVQLVADGERERAQVLLQQVKSEYGATRFGQRLAAERSGLGASAALFGVVAGAVLPVLLRFVDLDALRLPATRPPSPASGDAGSTAPRR